MGKKKIIFIVIGIIILILIGIFGYMMIQDLRQQTNLVNEISEISQMFNQSTLDYDAIEQRLSTNISTGDYLVVEKSLKEYLSDVTNSMRELQTTLEDERITTLLTAQNYSEDGPDFINTKEYIQNTRSTLERIKEEMISYVKEEKINEYINDKGLDRYYVDLYNELMGDTQTAQADIEELEKSLDDVISMLTNSEAVIDFLIENKGQWEVQDENIVFTTDDLVSQYNQYVSNIY